MPKIAAGVAAMLLTPSTVGLSLAAEPAIPAPPATQPVAEPMPADFAGTETIVFLRHGEKTAHELGQLTPQGLNRALALCTVLPKLYGKPDYLFAPDPELTRITSKNAPSYDYVRPLATIEPLAISLGMPVQTPFGFAQISKLNTELTLPKYARATIFIAWEHGKEREAAADLIKQFHGDPASVPHWPGADYDSLYVIKITRAPGKPATATFTHDHEGLDHCSKTMPVPATEDVKK